MTPRLSPPFCGPLDGEGPQTAGSRKETTCHADTEPTTNISPRANRTERFRPTRSAPALMGGRIMILAPREIEFLHFHLFAGLGGGAKGFNAGRAQVGHARARFRCIGGVDVDAAAIADFSRLARVPGTVLDMFSREQYMAFHGYAPPDHWREAQPDDLRRAARGERPHIIFGSAPCKGFSGLLSESRSASLRYQTLNQLAIRGLWLALEAWGDDPPEFVLWENVPRIATRGRTVLDTMIRILDTYGYAVAETTHDCGELGNLAQTRKRFLLVARHREKVPPFLYQPPRRPLRAVGDVLGALPLPDAEEAGPMHRMRMLQWRTWVRLAFVQAGSDWRSLRRLRVVDGQLADFGIAPERAWYAGALGVTKWSDAAHTITSEGLPQNGPFAVADPRRIAGRAEFGQYGVKRWNQTSQTVIGKAGVGAGHFAVADPRPQWSEPWGQLGVTPWDQTVPTIIGVRAPGQGRYSVADPRLGRGPSGPKFNNCFRVVRFADPSPAVTGGAGPSAGGLAVADPRIRIDRTKGDYESARLYGVIPWDGASLAVTASACHDNGAFTVADPRLPDSDARHLNQWRVEHWDRPAHTIVGATRPGSGALCVSDPRYDQHDSDGASVTTAGGERGEYHRPSESLPAPDTRLVAVIRATDGTWHRPFTTLELAALQGLVDPAEHLELHGTSDTAWRERIGNAVPSPAAAAIASVMAETLLLAMSGETFLLSATPIWVRPVAVAISTDTSAGVL
jgi:site-specific DNA-cytosine methylase